VVDVKHEKGVALNTTSTKRVLLACVTALAASAIATSAATAAPAYFNMGGGPMQLGSATSLVVKAGTTPTPATTYTCAPANQSWGGVWASNMGAYGYLSAFNASATCVNGLGAAGGLIISNNTSTALRGEQNGGNYSLTGLDGMSIRINRPSGGPIIGGGGPPTTPFSAPWTNGTSTNPSTVAFTNASLSKIGFPSALAGQPITVTGTISVDPGFPLLLN
jgi:hypothetical protein